mmetsp:Transcript_74230/g.221497  ORF Transcript_74230/g.221497 Transcript_74230/m.221497 type:complete len:233 (-) Transcript_74230:129-827(-)
MEETKLATSPMQTMTSLLTARARAVLGSESTLKPKDLGVASGSAAGASPEDGPLAAGPVISITTASADAASAGAASSAPAWLPSAAAAESAGTSSSSVPSAGVVSGGGTAAPARMERRSCMTFRCVWIPAKTTRAATKKITPSLGKWGSVNCPRSDPTSAPSMSGSALQICMLPKQNICRVRAQVAGRAPQKMMPAATSGVTPGRRSIRGMKTTPPPTPKHPMMNEPQATAR